MTFRTYLFFLLFLASFQLSNSQMIVGADTLVGNEWIQYGQQYYKFTVAQDGAYRISKNALEAAGINSAELIGSNVRLYNLGRQVPVYVSTQQQFNDEDFIEFYGHKNKSELDRYLFRRPDQDLLNPDYSIYTDTNVYYLTLQGVDVPLRVTHLVNNLMNLPPQKEYYLYTESRNFNSTAIDPYFPLAEGGSISYSSYMHGEGFADQSQINSSHQLASVHRYIEGPNASLRVRLTSTNNGSHSFVISLNNQNLDTIDLVNQQISDITYQVPTAILNDNNQLNVTSLNAVSRHSMVSIDLTYARLPILNSGSSSEMILTGQPVSQYHVLSGFSLQGQSPIIYSTDGLWRMVAETDAQNNIVFQWPETLEDLSLVIFDPVAGISSITDINEITFTDYSGDDPEYIVITHPSLMDIGTSSEYIQYRSSTAGGGFKAKAYSIFDIYDQFGYGIQKHPQAIRNFVEYMDRQWPSAAMIYIVGRGIEYNRSRVAGTWEPSFFVPTFGRPGSDNLLAGTVWDLVPRFPIGRLAIIQQSEVDDYLEKVREHDAVIFNDQTIEDKAWIKNIIHIGGGKTASEQEEFKQVLASLGNRIQQSDFGAKISFFQKNSTDIIGESQSKQIEYLLNEGSTIINYLGHSSANTFEFTINDPSEWNNKGRYPVFSAMGCSAGQIHGPTPSLSDKYVQIADEGAIAFISGSGSQFASALSNWANPWYEFIGTVGYGKTLGESILYGLDAISNFVSPELNSSNQYRFLLEQQTFQGDPALRFHPFAGPDYLVDRRAVDIMPDVLDTKLDSFQISFSILNIGRNLRENVDYTITLRLANGQEKELKQGSVVSKSFETRVSLTLPLAIDRKPGIYRVLITLDPENLNSELPAPAAENNNRLIDNLGVEGIEFVIVDNLIAAAYPPDFAIVNDAAPELVATSSNAFAPLQDIVMELDTTALFNSPLLRRERFDDHSGTVKWKPNVGFTPDQVYYWRVSTDSISPVPGYIWSKRSFTYLPSSPNGWNQSHFHQFTADDLELLRPDSTHHDFTFATSVTNFRLLNLFQDPVSGTLPFGYIDGVFFTEFFSRFGPNNVHTFVVAVDPVTGEFMRNPPPGLYGSFNNLSFAIKSFPFATDTPESRQALINFIENVIPDNYFVFLYTYQRPAHPTYFPEQWAGDEAIFGKSIFSVIESYFASSQIRSLADQARPYIVFFQKNKGGIEEVIASDTTETISLSYDIQKSLTQGTFVSRLVGPASSWNSIQWDFKPNAADTAGINFMSVYAVTDDFSDTILISSNLISKDTNITGIDAKMYPYLQLRFSTQDSVSYDPADILFWRVLYEGLPELIINTDLGFEYIADTLFQGDQMSLRTHIENVSDYPVDSLPVTLRIISTNNTTEELNQVVGPIGQHANVPVAFYKQTDDLAGDYKVVFMPNASREVKEENFENNIGILPLHVRSDRLNPVLDVTFDGHHILDGDLVSSKPLIVIQLHDENENLRLDDTSSFAIFLKYPSDFQARPIPFSNPWLQFNPSGGSGQNIASVEFRPELLEDGPYTLQVRAQDATGNLAGNNDYLISFEVINATSISYLYNYPNPFSTSTRFVYTLTGADSPPHYKIQIMSITGRLVREITQEELGPLTVGTHMTAFTWDGTDENGDRLAAGTYLYRLIVKDQDLEDIDHYDTGQDNTFFNKGWGKLVIIR